MRPPPGLAPVQTGTTSTGSNGETKRSRQLNGRIVRLMKAAGLEPHGYQVRSLAATLVANRETPSDEDIVVELMRAPWFPKPRIRRHGVGDPGWRTRS